MKCLYLESSRVSLIDTFERLGAGLENRRTPERLKSIGPEPENQSPSPSETGIRERVFDKTEVRSEEAMTKPPYSSLPTPA